jgi:hypothetical protein
MLDLTESSNRAASLEAGRAAGPTTRPANISAPRIDPSEIPGWGIDSDPENDPTYPMRDVSKDDTAGLHWHRPALQHPTVEILHSTEHPRLPAVFGTSCPPSGLSGLMRRRAFRHSEGKWAHWLMLLMADRVNVVEGIFQDFGQGRFPNIYAEMGGPAEWKHNRTGFVRKAAIGALILAALVIVIVILAD